MNIAINQNSKVIMISQDTIESLVTYNVDRLTTWTFVHLNVTQILNVSV